MFRRRLLTVALGLLPFALAHAVDAEVIFQHARVVTVDPAFSIHEAIAGTKVLRTYVGGKLVFTREDSPPSGD